MLHGGSQMKLNANSLSSLFPDARSVKARVDLVDFASQFTRLRRSGRQLVGLCPLHRERRPSFFVHPERQIFFCHGCQRGGDVFSLVMYQKACGFVEAVRAVAQFVSGEGPPPKAKPEVGNATTKSSRPHSWESGRPAREPKALCLDTSPRDIPPCFFADIGTCADTAAYKAGARPGFARTTTNNCCEPGKSV
jgi:hypothetical protein